MHEYMDREKLTKMLNGSSKVVGSKQVLKGISDGTVRCVIVAADADVALRQQLYDAAAARKVELYQVPSKRRLGQDAGVEVAAAAVGIVAPEA